MHTPLPLRYDWLDFESIDVSPDAELWEVAVIGTDAELRELYAFTTLLRPTARGIASVKANPILFEMHTKSGLLADIESADWSLLPTVADVEQYILDLHAKFAVDGNSVSLAGSGVAHYDRQVVAAQMPALSSKLTYNSGEIGGSRRFHEEAVGHDVVEPLPEKLHRAEDDIRDDLRHARAFRDLYIANDLRTAAEAPLERALLSLTLVDAYSKHDAFTTAEGEFYTPDTAEIITTLMTTTDPTDLILGLLDIASTLLHQTARHENAPAAAVVGRLRTQLLTGS